jgi:hypothetical protein
MKLEHEESQEFEDFIEYINENYTPRPWYKPWAVLNNKSLRLYTVIFYDCSTVSKSLTKKHFIDILLPMHRKGFESPLAGFQVWY